MKDFELLSSGANSKYRVVHALLRTARRQFVCSECFAPIVRADRYAQISALHDNKWGYWRVCYPCAEAYVWLFQRTKDWEFGCLAEKLDYWAERSVDPQGKELNDKIVGRLADAYGDE